MKYALNSASEPEETYRYFFAQDIRFVWYIIDGKHDWT
jgi:hypothetical protein